MDRHTAVHIGEKGDITIADDCNHLFICLSTHKNILSLVVLVLLFYSSTLDAFSAVQYSVASGRSIGALLLSG